MLFFIIVFFCLHIYAREKSISTSSYSGELKEFLIKQFPKYLGNGHYHSDPNFILHRRNHDCHVIKNQLVLIGGRFQPTLETIDPSSGNAPHQVVRNDTFLELSHIYTVKVDPLNTEDAKKYEWEIWIPCGLYGDEVKSETSIATARIIRKKRNDPNPFELIVGPKLPHPSGACSAALLKIDGPHKPGHICMFAGSDGSHDKGRFHREVMCYDRAKQKWNFITHVPVAIDHHSMVRVPEVPCPGNGTIGPYIFIFHGRTKSFGKAIDEVHAWKLPEHKQQVNIPGYHMSSFKNASWEIFTTDDYPRDASAAMVTVDGRYVIAFGGVTHRMKHDTTSHSRLKKIRVLDVCTRKWHASKIELNHPRYAIEPCRNGRYPIICGGTYEEPLTMEPRVNQNLASCEIFDTEEIVNNLVH